MLAHVILLNTLGRYSIEWASMTRCAIRIFTKHSVSIFLTMRHVLELSEHLCRKSLHCLEHIHLEEQGLTGVAGESQKQNILYALWSICFSLYQNFSFREFLSMLCLCAIYCSIF